MNGNNIEVVGWQCRCACEECVGAEWGNCSQHDYEAAMADPEMQARELVAASDAQAIIAQRDARNEEQAREIERLTLAARVSAADANDAERELSALKAQPSGVVVAGMADALRHVIKELDAEACEDIDYAQVSGALGAYELFGRGLNSSPVSAGEPCKFLKEAERRLNAVLGYSEEFDDLLATVNTACLRIRRLEGSAGGVDERAAFEAAVREDAELSGAGDPDLSLLNCKIGGRVIYSNKIMQACWWAWNQRAALNAGSAVPEADVYRRAVERIAGIGSDSLHFHPSHMSRIAREAMKAASPTAKKEG